ncbi:NADP-dependent aldehyde dehydrogenase [Saccharopolyspora lacisalsi]|uniref:NADP-dependent aldehyde dehydrogenase n=1 Tax=Halosaccharopolyspora lacisalsi TaxID=1000566 RepID=A0A839E213_9PSEU|nr:aldehyde dehydrogenase (NADP(+)) [Halosaccharopolyspora lacisalsi]MBA8825765.1 NADP-dependent aldehyde dehydrogenase [Halosaccharopolyspora lacisalsi]
MTTETVTGEAELAATLDAAERASRPLARLRPAQRAGILRGIAQALDAAGDELIPLAERESHLPRARLTGELTRTTFQLRLFADVLDEGTFLNATIDLPDASWPTGARPDMRRTVLPLGPVVVFAASNFPFAFSVAGGDTASALAAGCPVVLKTHPGHPELSRRTGEIIDEALRETDAPAGTFALISGDEAGRTAVQDHRVRAGAFTGSATAGRALFDLANSRPDPIPFHSEMGSVNPAFVTPRAAAQRPDDIADGYLGSFTLGTGQFCTKPGVLFVPSESTARFEQRLASSLEEHAGGAMLNSRIQRGFQESLTTLTDHPAIRVITPARPTEQGSTPSLLATSAAELLRHHDQLLTECFGPTSILVSYSDEEELAAAAELFQGELTATVQGTAEEEIVSRLATLLQHRVGRLVYNGWPTGVSVSHAMQHGGPYPATTGSGHTSVGTAAIDRFLRPVSYQNAPAEILPEELLDENPLGVARRVNGVLDTTGGALTPPETP